MISFSREDSQFLAYLRSLSILVIVFGHIGLFWVYKPYSEFLHVFIPIFFFISGADWKYSLPGAILGSYVALILWIAGMKLIPAGMLFRSP